MDPLSALRSMMTPGVQATPLAADAVGAPRIPTQELAKLGPGMQLAEGQPSAGGFDSVLGNLVSEVDAKQKAAGATVAGLIGGENVSLHQAMIAMEEASVSFQLMVEVRNKLLESYQELMRMQV